MFHEKPCRAVKYWEGGAKASPGMDPGQSGSDDGSKHMGPLKTCRHCSQSIPSTVGKLGHGKSDQLPQGHLALAKGRARTGPDSFVLSLFPSTLP